MRRLAVAGLLLALATRPAAADTFTLLISGPVDADLAPVIGRLTTVFYQSYPKLLKRFENPAKPASRTIRLVVAPGLKPPAQCGGDRIEVSPEYLRAHPDDLGLLTHELTHVVQAYPPGGPGWLTEGIADYARQLYGPEKQPGWKLPARLRADQSYRDSYGTTARFLVWLEAKHPGAVDKVHRRMQEGGFQPDEFRRLTGTDVDELWRAAVAETAAKP